MNCTEPCLLILLLSHDGPDPAAGKGAGRRQAVASVLQLGGRAGADRETKRRPLSQPQSDQPSNVPQGPRGESFYP